MRLAFIQSYRLNQWCSLSISSKQFVRMNSTEGCDSKQKRSTAGIIVIGDEILKGQVRDTNSHFITKHLHSYGVRVNKVGIFSCVDLIRVETSPLPDVVVVAAEEIRRAISVIPDSVPAISDEVREFAGQYDFVITSGGIGPTHDDLTFEGVAAAFGDETALRPELSEFVEQYFKASDTSLPCFKLARVPTRASLVYAEDKQRGVRSRFPVVKVQNVYVLPGVPHLLEKAFLLLAKDHFVNAESHFCCDTVYLSLDEVSLAAALNQTVAACPDVTFGSYPELYHSYYKTRVTLEAAEMARVSVARARLVEALPGGAEVSYLPDPVTEAWPPLERLAQQQPHVQQAVDVLEECLRRYRPEEVCLCFNGGKDCTAVLHLVHALLQRHQLKGRLRAVYIREQKPFPAMEQFVEEARVRYDLDLFTIPGPMKEGLQAMKGHWPEVKATIMGTRHGDPYAHLMSPFQPTDADWPPLMRVNPILVWQYQQLWHFVRTLSLSYCSLYDRGYTSLGSVDNTLPNPALQTVTSAGSVTYRPAYELEEGARERDGRIRRQS